MHDDFTPCAAFGVFFAAFGVFFAAFGVFTGELGHEVRSWSGVLSGTRGASSQIAS